MKTALITGAYRGLGLEAARQLSDRGWRIIVTARKPEAGQKAAAQLKNATFLELDISDAASAARAAKQVEQLDVLINNAAIYIDGNEDISGVAPETVVNTFLTNVLGSLRVAQSFVPVLVKSDAGRIINVSSGGGQLSSMVSWAPAYSISKTALNAVTCQLAAALKDRNVAVNCVCPGWCRTEMGGANATRSAKEGADGIVWLAADAPQEKTGLFWRDRQVIPW